MKVCANIISPLILNAQQNGPFLPDLFEGWGAAAPSGYLACGATPGHKGGKHRSTTTSSLKRALSPFALTAMTDPGPNTKEENFSFLSRNKHLSNNSSRNTTEKSSAGVLQLISKE